MATQMQVLGSAHCRCGVGQRSVPAFEPVAAAPALAPVTGSAARPGGADLLQVESSVMVLVAVVWDVHLRVLQERLRLLPHGSGAAVACG